MQPSPPSRRLFSARTATAQSNPLFIDTTGLVTMVDHWLGKLLDTLREVGKEKDTLVIFASDHGTNFGDNLEKATGKPAAVFIRARWTSR